MEKEVIGILASTLKLGPRAANLRTETPLLGNLPELDSMAVVAVITALEDYYGFSVSDDDISAETFATVGSLANFVKEKQGA